MVQNRYPFEYNITNNLFFILSFILSFIYNGYDTKEVAAYNNLFNQYFSALNLIGTINHFMDELNIQNFNGFTIFTFVTHDSHT